jgi:hypothetical protein
LKKLREFFYFRTQFKPGKTAGIGYQLRKRKNLMKQKGGDETERQIKTLVEENRYKHI